MKGSFILALTLIGQTAFASPSLTQGDLGAICEKAQISIGNGNFMTVDNIIGQNQEFTFVSNYGREKDSNRLIIIENSTALAILEINLGKYKVSDINAEQAHLWFVANASYDDSRLYHIDLRNSDKLKVNHYPTHNETVELGRYDKAYGLSIDEKYVYIAHGGLGVVKFGKENLKPIAIINPNVNPSTKHRSYATDVLVIKNKLFVGLDNITYNFGNKTRAFEGYAILNKQNLSLQKSIPINQKREALFEPKLFLNGDKIVMSTFALQFVNQIKNIENSKIFTPQRRIYRYSNGAKPIGLPTLKDGKLIGCFRDDRKLPAKTFAHIENLKW